MYIKVFKFNGNLNQNISLHGLCKPNKINSRIQKILPILTEKIKFWLANSKIYNTSI